MDQTDAPLPWRIVDYNSERYGYIRIVDGAGKPICDFFPHGNGRGRNATLVLAKRIVEAIEK